MAFQAVNVKIGRVRIFVTVHAFAEAEVDVAGLDRVLRSFFRMTFVAIDFRMLSGQGIIRLPVVEGLGIQIDDVRVKTLMVVVTGRAASLELAVIALPTRESRLHGFVAVKAERIVYPFCQSMARIAILQLFLFRVRAGEFSGREESGERREQLVCARGPLKLKKADNGKAYRERHSHDV